MGQLFDPELVYPRDDVGVYVDLEGTVTKVEEPLGNDVAIEVDTPEGNFIGYWRFPSRSPKIGDHARIRIYAGGGGFYPDNRITGWMTVPKERG